MRASLSSEPGTAAGLGKRYREVRAATLALCETLSPEDAQAQSMPDASPAKWHLAHTTWFFETLVLAPHAARYEPFDPSFRVLFNSYYQSVGRQHPRSERGLLTRPACLLLVITMVQAGRLGHRGAGYLITNEPPGAEYTINLAVICAVFALTGPGRISLDALVF